MTSGIIISENISGTIENKSFVGWNPEIGNESLIQETGSAQFAHTHDSILENPREFKSHSYILEQNSLENSVTGNTLLFSYQIIALL